MDGLLSNYPGWQKLRMTIRTKSNPTTPTPMLNPEAIKQLNQQKIQAEMVAGQNRFYYEQPDRLRGVSACYAALDECLRTHEIISSALWVPDDCMKEIRADVYMRYKAQFNGYIPYLHGSGMLSPNGQVVMQTKIISVIVDHNMHEDHIVCILP